MAVDEITEPFKRGCEEIKTAEKVIDISLPVAASRAYIAGENLAYAIVLKTYGSSSRSHGKVWRCMHELYEKGTLNRDYKPMLEESYRMRIKGDYGRDIGGSEIEISKGLVKKHLDELKELKKELEALIRE